MLTQFSRTELLLGKEAMNKLEDARVAVFGIGDRKSTRLNSSHTDSSRMPSSA